MKLLTPGAHEIFYFPPQNPVPFVQNVAVYQKNVAGFAQNVAVFGEQKSLGGTKIFTKSNTNLLHFSLFTSSHFSLFTSSHFSLFTSSHFSLFTSSHFSLFTSSHSSLFTLHFSLLLECVGCQQFHSRAYARVRTSRASCPRTPLSINTLTFQDSAAPTLSIVGMKK